MSLGKRVEDALDRIGQASPEQMRAATARMPTYLRLALLWLARELDLLAQVPPAPDPSPAQGRSMQLAVIEKSRLERLIAESAATPAERAFLQQALAHLWARVREAHPCKAPR